LKVKLDTNGTNPKILQELIDKKLVDFVAMDIKTSLPKYESIIETKCNIEDIKKSIDILMKSGIDYEFRTTFAPDVSLEDIEEIAKTIKGAKSYAIQKYNPLDEKIMKIPHSLNDFKLANEKAKQYVNSFLRSLN
jgi:pyruvate formate lyase activating enzyme